MFNNNTKSMLLFVLLMGLFVCGLIRLFQIRFEAGDLYPRYSSLRKDPLGACALFEGIRDISDKRIDRNYKRLDKIPMSPDTTLFILGLSGYDQKLTSKDWENLFDHLSKNGGRVVISFSPAGIDFKEESSKSDEEKESSDASSPDDIGSKSNEPSGEKIEDNAAEGEKKVDNKDIWSGISELGLKYISIKKNNTSEEKFAVKTLDAPDYFPEHIHWRRTGSFEAEDPTWHMIYAQNDAGVVASRKWGKGSVVLLADSYLLSNEGLQKNRVPLLLSWLVGPSIQVLFDEFHHGLLETLGTVDLIKRYRLQGVILSLFFVVGLLIWRQMALMPVISDGGHKPVFFPSEGGADPSQGWVVLVERHIPPKDLLNVGFDAWLNSEASNRVAKDRQGAARKIMAEHNSSRQSNKNKTTYTKLYKLIKQGTLS